MTLRRALPLVLVLAAVPFQPALAQFGGMPGMPGAPGMPGGGGGFGAAPPPQQRQEPPPACQQLLVMRDDVQKHGMALQAAGKQKKGPEVACKLFKSFLAAESKMIRGLDQHATTCGVPENVIKQLKTQHAQAEKSSVQVCEAAARGPAPSGPSLSDALGTTPTIPDAAEAKKGAGTFETLTGNPLQR
jgi:hypothetical protein